MLSLFFVEISQNTDDSIVLFIIYKFFVWNFLRIKLVRKIVVYETHIRYVCGPRNF